MKHDVITSARKRRAAALNEELEELLQKVRRGEGDIAAQLVEANELSQALDATRRETDDYDCFRCGADVDVADLQTGGLHFVRMSRHDETQKIVANGSAELKVCAPCYTLLYERILGHSVHITKAELKAARSKR
jgi:hypothetical protein